MKGELQSGAGIERISVIQTAINYSIEEDWNIPIILKSWIFDVENGWSYGIVMAHKHMCKLYR